MSHRKPFNVSRRNFLATTGAASAMTLWDGRRVYAQTSDPIELVHWSFLTASDGEIWASIIDGFNEVHKDSGLSIRVETIPDDQFRTKLTAAVASGQGPDFGWCVGGKDALLAKEGITVGIDALAQEVGLDLADFSERSIAAARYPRYSSDMHLVPMDVMSLQPLINLDHVAEAGLDPANPPKDNAELLEWAKAMTKRDGDTVTRSGILMTGDGLQPCVTWGIVSRQMGFLRTNAEMTEAAINPEAGIRAMEWVLALFDEHKVSTRDVTDRYRAFGQGEGSIFWTGPWTLPGYQEAGLNFRSIPFPNIGGELHTYFELGGLQVYKQADRSRNVASMQAIKWLSDNSFRWTTEGRGASPRKSILSRPDYMTAGLAPELREAFVAGMEFADIGEVPVLDGPDFTIYNGGNFLAQTLEGVWAGQVTPAEAMQTLTDGWNAALQKG